MSQGRNNTNEVNTGSATAFLQLTDVYETTYAGSENAYVTVNEAGNGLVFNDTPPTGATEFIQLTDAPNFYTANNYVVVNGEGTALTYTAVAPPQAFTDLTDCPDTLVGANNLFVKVNSGATGLTFASQNIPQAFINLSDTPSTYSGTDPGDIVTVNSSTNGLSFSSFPVSAIPTVFTDLTDCPDTLVGNENLILRVNNSATALIFTAEEPFPFTTLTDVPSSFSGSGGDYVTVNMAENALVFTAAPPSATTFLDLTDCPSSYTSANNYYVKVNSGATGLTFVAGGDADVGLLDLNDYTGTDTYSGKGGLIASVNPTASGFTLQTGTFMQRPMPYLVFGFSQNFAPNWNMDPPELVYNFTDIGNFGQFGNYRYNYTDTNPFMNGKYTAQRTYTYVIANPSADMRIYQGGIGNAYYFCGVDPSPMYSNLITNYSNYSFDIKVTVNGCIILGNIDQNIICFWLNTYNYISGTLQLMTPQQQMALADQWWCDIGGDNIYPENRCQIAITKILTIPVSSLNIAANCSPQLFFSCRLKSDFTAKNSFTIRNLEYFNVTAEILNFHL